MKADTRTVLVTIGGLLLAACGGGGSGGSVSPPPPPPPPPPAGSVIDVQRVFPNLVFDSPVAMVQAPGDATRWYLVEKAGVVRMFGNDESASVSDVFVDISARVDDGPNEAGLLGIAFHPSFPTVPDVFLSYTAPGSPLISRLSRFSLDAADPDVLDPGSEEILLVIPQPQGNHNGGDLDFGPESEPTLYAAFGDGGGIGDPNENAQNTATLLGSIIRILVNTPGGYDIPPDNPFASANLCNTGSNTNAPCPEIFAWGLRNPWRMSFDAATGNLWLGDVGQDSFEEIDRIDSSQQPLDRNFGWDHREGAHCFEPASGCATDFIEPVTEYGRSLGGSVTGGHVYRGSAVTDLAGLYVFADFLSGRIFSVPADSQPTVVPDELLETALRISTFAEDASGELYVVDYVGGTIHKIVAAP